MRALIRAGKYPEEMLRPEAVLQRGRNGVFGSNVGNLLFSDAVYRTLNVPGTELVPDAFTTERPGVDSAHVARINDEFDHFILPLANAFRPAFVPSLNKLSAVIEKLHLPVTVIGVGAQLSAVQGESVEDLPSSLAGPVSRFMRAVLDRSAKVGVRGGFTRDYLATLGFGEEHVDVIGCPSLLDRPEYRIEKRVGELSTSSTLAFNAVPSLETMGEVLEAHRARFPNTYYVQQEHRELALLMWGKPIEGEIARAFPGTVEHANYRHDVLRFFVDTAGWRAFLAECDFSFGNRIHGNIAALTAGTPAVVLSHDSRTRELADYHRIPHRAMPAAAADVRAEELYESADFAPFHEVQAENLARYTSFLEVNQLAHIHAPGNENDAYDQLLSAVRPGRPVRSLAVEGQDTLVSRINWLWQSPDADRRRTTEAYSPPFVPDSDPAARVRAAAVAVPIPQRLSNAEKQIAQLRADNSALRQELEELRRWSSRPFAVVPEGSVLRRLARRVRRSTRRVRRSRGVVR